MSTKKENDEQLMKRLFRLVPPVPKNLEKQLRQNELRQICYLFTFRSNGKRLGYCTECKRIVSLEMKRTETTEEFLNRNKKHNEVGFCPECKSHVTFKDSGRGAGKLWGYRNFILAQKAGKYLLFRFFVASRSFSSFSLDKSTGEVSHVGEVELHEEYRLFLDAESRKAYQFINQWDYFGLSWRKKKTVRTDFLNYTNCQIYGLDKKLLEKTNFKYCPIDIYEKVTNGRGNYLDFLVKYTRCPEAVEYMMKCGFANLFCNLMKFGKTTLLNLRAKTPEKLLRLPKAEIARLRNDFYGEREQLDYQRLEFLQLLQNYDFSVAQRQNLVKNVSPYTFKHYYCVFLKYTTLTKTENYIKKHAKGSLLPIQEYADYITTCEHLGFDLTRHEVLFPKDLFEAHDRVNALIRAERARKRAEQEKEAKEKRLLEEKEVDEKIKKQFGALSKKWKFRSNGYLIRPAKSLEEIIDEGNTQNICVGSKSMGYTKRHATGEAFIFFVRSEKEPEKPLCTVEITSDGTVVQCRGYHNAPPSEEVRRFMEKFKLYVQNGILEKSV